MRKVHVLMTVFHDYINACHLHEYNHEKRPSGCELHVKSLMVLQKIQYSTFYTYFMWAEKPEIRYLSIRRDFHITMLLYSALAVI